jgi:ADP-heptose:LPS heptosyltransferase
MPISSKPSILIILMGSLGDVARGLGLVSHIKAHLPESRITWLVEPKCAALVGLHPQIDHIIEFERKRSVAAVWDLFKELNQKHFDITLDLQRILKSGFFSLLFPCYPEPGGVSALIAAMPRSSIGYLTMNISVTSKMIFQKFTII